jgi:SAM-dependent methyltransferase
MSFDRLARHYRWMERVLAGDTLQRARTAWLAQVGTPRRALLVGEGNGRFLAAALGALPTTRFVCVDASDGMLEMARRAVPRGELGRVEFEHRVLPGWSPDRAGFDLLVTHFFLDCFPAETLERLVPILAQGLEPNAPWLIADFVLPARGPARWRARVIHALMYAFFRWATRLPARSLAAPEPWLLRNGFTCAAQQEFEWGLIRSSLWRRPGTHP